MKYRSFISALFVLTAVSTAAAPTTDVQKFSFGNGIEVYAIRDRDSSMKASLFTDTDKPVIAEKAKPKAGTETKTTEKKTNTASAEAAAKKEYPASVNVFVLRTTEKTFLIDGGNFDPGNSLISKLESAKIRPRNIDYILITHLHPDHIGGLIDKNGAALFPSATVHISSEELKHWRPIIAEQKSTDLLRRFYEAYKQRIRPLNFGEPTANSVFALKAIGHTPGHCFYRIGKLRFVGDVIHAAGLQFANPGFSASFDQSPKQAAATRRWFLETMHKDGSIVFGAHLPFPGVGTISREGETYSFEPYTEKK